MRLRTFMLCLGCALLAALPALAQGIPTGTLSGRVTTGTEALPGVTVTATSPALQGARSTTSTETGDYIIPLLPPGEYTVSFELQGFQTAQRSVKLSVAQTSRLDVEMGLEQVTEEIVVTGTYETISATPQAATTYEKKFVEALPVERDIRDTLLLTPGVFDTGPGTNARSRNISIAGSQSYENLFLVNGVVINENLRGQPFDLFIEDAVEEVTTTVSGVSAEYGRFAGGVVNTITKSGGNQFEGSFRTNFTSDKWVQPTPVTGERADQINRRYEATLGGYLWRDHLWFFAAGRDFEESLTDETTETSLPYEAGNDERRIEGKLTLSPFEGHRVIGSYIEIEETDFGNRFQNVLDLASITDRELPQELRALNYTGVVTDSFFVEAQYSEREFTFINSGSRFRDLIRGTLLVDQVTGFRWNSPTFCGVCTPEERNNENLVLKGSWFLSNDVIGSHDIAFGYDTFDDVRLANNHQSGSDFRLLINETIIDGTNLFPVIIGEGADDDSGRTIIQWNPIFVESRGTSFKTNSFFVNDRWRLNERWSFNVGLRYDENDGQNSEGQTVANDSRISPRLAATFDLRGDGNWIFNAAYGQYATALANNQGDQTSRGGNPATFQFSYRGPDINGAGAGLIPADVALQMVFDWFDGEGGTDNLGLLRGSPTIPGGTNVIRGSLDSPYTDEIAFGVNKRLGTKGTVRFDLVHREAHDFYFDRRDLTTGSTPTPTGALVDLSVIENNDDLLKREYNGLHTQFQYRWTDRFSLGGIWTLSETTGNFDGETAANGPISSNVGQYPEYKQERWNNPEGYLGIDQRHRVRAWGIYNLLDTEYHRLDLSLLQNFFTGGPYGAVGTVNSRNFVTNPGYRLPPASVAYFYTDRDEFRSEDITATDLSLNYTFQWNAFGRGVEVFLQPEVLNVFDEQGVLRPNSAIRTSVTTPFRCPGGGTSCPDGTPGATGYRPFNPFTQTPVEGPSGSGANWERSANFGKGVNEEDFQQPRTIRFSVGIRF